MFLLNSVWQIVICKSDFVWRWFRNAEISYFWHYNQFLWNSYCAPSIGIWTSIYRVRKRRGTYLLFAAIILSNITLVIYEADLNIILGMYIVQSISLVLKYIHQMCLQSLKGLWLLLARYHKGPSIIYHTVQKLRVISNKSPRTFDSCLSIYMS